MDRAIKLQEQKIASEGGDFARRREELLKAQYEWQASLDSCEAELRELANGLLPFCLAPELCETVRQRVEAEAEARHEQAAASMPGVPNRTNFFAYWTRQSFWLETFGREPTKDYPRTGCQSGF